jgi:hypothetical protein
VAAATDAAAAAAVDAAAATQWVAAVASTQWVAVVADALEAAAAVAVADALEAAADVAESGGGAAAAVYRGARASSARPHRLVALIYKGAENAAGFTESSRRLWAMRRGKVRSNPNQPAS